jgi:RecA/RadA recombinase
MAQINDELPGVRVESAADAHNPYTVRRPTGIIDLDLGTGGGLPAGGGTEISGAENAGKNMLCNLVMAENQRIHGQDSAVAIIGIEYDWDKKFARDLGMTVPYSDSELRMLEQEAGYEYSDEVRAELKSEVGEIRMVSAATAEEALETMYKIIASDLYQIVVLDSIASLLTADESEASLVDQKMYGMGIPRIMARFFRKLTRAYHERPRGRPNLTTFIGTNQLMDKVGGFQRPGMPTPTKEKGGWAVRHGKLLNITLKKGAWIKEGTTKAGHEVNWKIGKGKAGCSDGAAGSFKFHTTDENFGPDRLAVMYRVALAAGIIQKAGAYYSVPTLGIERTQGKARTLDKIRDVGNWYELLYHALMQSYDIEAYNRWAEIS